jgi:hypothetical protein
MYRTQILDFLEAQKRALYGDPVLPLGINLIRGDRQGQGQGNKPFG